jgi:hypothetical protein
MVQGESGSQHDEDHNNNNNDDDARTDLSVAVVSSHGTGGRKHVRPKWKASSDTLLQDGMCLVHETLAFSLSAEDRKETKRLTMECIRLWRLVTATEHYRKHGRRVYKFDKHCHVVLSYMRKDGLRRQKDQKVVIESDAVVRTRLPESASRTYCGGGTLTDENAVFRGCVPQLMLT